jgi:hypothetical protein
MQELKGIDQYFFLFPILLKTNSFSETESPRILDQLFRRHLLSHVGTHPFKVKFNIEKIK